MTRRPTAYGAAGALLLAVGCGRAGDESQSLLPLGTLRGPGYLAPEPSEPGGSELPPLGAVGDPTAAEEVFPGERAVLDVIQRACGACHSAEPGDPGAFLFSILDLQGAGWLVPGSGEASRLAVWLQYGYGGARPGHSSLDIEPGAYRAVVDFINDMEFVQCTSPQPFGRDAVTEAMLRDIQARDPADRPFMRYIGITHGSPSARCGTFSVQDAAFVELLNAVSLGPRIVAPPLIETAFTHAIDLRDYAWNRPIDLGGGASDVTFPDAWEALVAMARPYAHELTGPEADALKLETGTAIPYVPAHVFVAVASGGDLYHALVGIRDGNSGATREALGVLDAGLRRAGMFGAPAPVSDRVVTRRMQGSEPARSWWTREWLEAASESEGLQRHPVDYPPSGGEIMFELPNGLHAFAVDSSDGALVNQVPSCLGALCDPPVAAENSITCRACHEAGRLILPPDEVRAFAENDPSAFDAPTLAAIRDQYRPDELRDLMVADDQRYDAAFQQLPEGANWYNRIGQVYNAFWLRPIDAVSAAAELGVTLEELRAAIGGVDPGGALGLAPMLGEGSVDRSVFKASYQVLACAIEGSRNVPAGCP